MTKIFIATPAFDGKTHVQYTVSLAETYALLASQGIQCVLKIHTSGSLLVAERNRLVQSFLESDCTHMLCIDSDLGWPPIAVTAMINHDLDFVAGCYPARGEKVFLFRPEYKENSALVVNEKNLIKMQYIPAGFMLIKRCVLEKLVADHPELYYEPKDPAKKHEKGYYFFQLGLRNGEFWGEDFLFCDLVRQSGFDIWVDPVIEFDHAGSRGMLINCLTNDPQNKVCENDKIPSSS